jgi:AraC-like DNA-binding protein
MSPTQYFKLLRMQDAKSILEATFLPIKQIAARVGGNDVSHFVRDFKKAYGMSPTQYREDYHSQPGIADGMTNERNG